MNLLATSGVIAVGVMLMTGTAKQLRDRIPTEAATGDSGQAQWINPMHSLSMEGEGATVHIGFYIENIQSEPLIISGWQPSGISDNTGIVWVRAKADAEWCAALGATIRTDEGYEDLLPVTRVWAGIEWAWVGWKVDAGTDWEKTKIFITAYENGVQDTTVQIAGVKESD